MDICIVCEHRKLYWKSTFVKRAFNWGFQDEIQIVTVGWQAISYGVDWVNTYLTS